jgi:polyisoprenoid-binding protein YceI
MPALSFYIPRDLPTNSQGIRIRLQAFSPMIRNMRKPILLGAAAAGLAVALVAGGAYVYYFSGLRTAPPQLGLSTPSASAATATATTTPTTGLAGKWTVIPGSVIGYRVKELFVGQTSKHEAVARTSTVSGGLTATGDSSTGFQVTAITLIAGLANLHSVDSVAGRDVTQRDGVVSRQIGVRQFPTATFTATSASVPGSVTTGQVDLTVTGKLTIHGVTKDVTVKTKAQMSGDKVEMAGSTSINMGDYGVSPPQVGFVTVDSSVLIEFDLFMTKAA